MLTHVSLTLLILADTMCRSEGGGGLGGGGGDGSYWVL